MKEKDTLKTDQSRGLPGGPVVLNLPANAETMVQALVWELRPRALRATATEAHEPRAHVLHKRRHHNESQRTSARE